jgi:DNA-directed RNA polymerase specialized sigma24 family protein
METEHNSWWPEGAAEPDWTAVFIWAQNIARINAWAPYRTDEAIRELASVGYLKVYAEWRRYRDEPMQKRTSYMRVAIVNAQKSFVGDLMHKGSPARQSHGTASAVLISISPECVSAGNVTADYERQVNNRADLTAVIAAIRHILTPSERRVMLLLVQHPEFADAEIAEHLGDISAKAVRVHKCNARKKLKRNLGWS